MKKRGDILFYGISAVFVLLSFLILPGKATAFGMSTPYIEGDILKLQPGQHYDYYVQLQNPEGEGFEVKLDYRAVDVKTQQDAMQIILLEEDVFFIPARSYDTRIPLRIEIPQDASYGTEYTLGLVATPRINASGQIPINVQLSKNIRIVVVSELGQGTEAQPEQGLISAILSLPSSISGIPAMQQVKTAMFTLAVVAGIALIGLFVKRFWKKSGAIVERAANFGKQSTSRIFSRKKFSTPLSGLASCEELFEAAREIPERQLMLPDIKRIVSEKCSEFGRHDLEKGILKAKTKKEILLVLGQQ